MIDIRRIDTPKPEKADESILEPRRSEEIEHVMRTTSDKLWYDDYKHYLNSNRSILPQILNDSKVVLTCLENMYGKKNLGPCTDFEYGMLLGRLRTLRWLLGEEWDGMDI